MQAEAFTIPVRHNNQHSESKLDVPCTNIHLFWCADPAAA